MPKVERIKARYFVGIVLVVGLFIAIYSSPRDFDKRVEGVYFKLGKDNTENWEKIDVEFHGDYIKRLFSGDKFRGNMEIGDTKIEFVELNFHKSNKHVIFGLLENDKEYKNYGVIYTNGNLDKFAIIILQGEEEYGSWSRKDGYMISAPCDDRDAAIGLANEMMKEYLIDITLE